jgi:MFS family permease
VLIGEIIRNEHRGKANGVVHSGWAVGWGAAAILYTALFSLLPEAIAWRILFGIGVLPALAVFFVRRYVDEPAVFLASKKQYESGDVARPNFLEIFSPAYLRTTVLASLLTIGTQGGYYAIMIWLPTYLKTVRGFPVLGTGGYLAVIIVASFLGYVAGAYLTDILGRRRNFFPPPDFFGPARRASPVGGGFAAPGFFPQSRSSRVGLGRMIGRRESRVRRLFRASDPQPTGVT